ncbi:isochorismatase family protein [Flammeovirga aprica]|uniref:Isochorismatase family protein n=1 Tax=Flammeovirga aprica JL-4 TaxID=694437 RepID=A0A7X9RYG8_9BACT|nr:isochorismatase family protein [Flammeovirga aprica]NME71033.1 isochorismatase family protein [Flammeovirga aprica JL-4]
MTTNKALLIIDMQKGSFTPQTPRYDHEGVVKRINSLSAQFRALKYPVFVAQHDGTGSGEFEKHTEAWENLDELQVKPEDILIDKYANDVFYQSELQEKLIQNNVGELFVTGCATDFCVESTIQSALTKEYIVNVVKDGHTTGERPNLKARQVIDHYNWVWQGMIPTKGKVVVKPLKEILEEIAEPK